VAGSIPKQHQYNLWFVLGALLVLGFVQAWLSYRPVTDAGAKLLLQRETITPEDFPELGPMADRQVAAQ